MKDFLKDELSIYQKFTMFVSNVFSRIRYGIAPCKDGCCEELHRIRFELLQWQKLKDDYVFSNSLYAGPDRTIAQPASVILKAVYISLSQPATIQWTQTSGVPGVITSPNSLLTTVTGLSLGQYEFTITVTATDGSVLTDSVLITVSSDVNSTYKIEWGFSLTDPFDTVASLVLQYNQDVIINDFVYEDLEFTNEANEKYLILKEPSSLPVKTQWTNTAFNYGIFPDQVFLEPVVIGDSRYYISRIPVFLGVGTTKITFQ